MVQVELEAMPVAPIPTTPDDGIYQVVLINSFMRGLPLDGLVMFKTFVQGRIEIVRRGKIQDPHRGRCGPNGVVRIACAEDIAKIDL